MTVLHECLDNDSPWLICKHCGAVGRCEKDPSPQPESVHELRAQLQTLGLWIAEALPTLDTVEPECSAEAELLTELIRRGEMLVLASLARARGTCPSGKCQDPATDCFGSGCLGPNVELSGHQRPARKDEK